jgi:DNA (cytosine-5)-methyltransferase 1
VKVGSLCTGYGGIELGLHLAGEDVDLRWVAETGPTAALMTPLNLGDIRTVDWSTVERVDLLTAGFPCQPVSAAGRQRGEADDRWLWPAVLDAITALMPDRVLLENVRNLVSTQNGELWKGILENLTDLGYDVRWLTLGACRVGAAHHRHRVFALATLDPWRAPTDIHTARRLDVPECGTKSSLLPTPTRQNWHGNHVNNRGELLLPGIVALLPTPAARDGDDKGRGEGDAAYWQTRAQTRTNGMPLGAAVTLLPSPQSRDGQGRGTPSVETAEQRFASGRRNLDDGLALLPTPTAAPGGSGIGPNAEGTPNLRTAVTLLPTPTLADSRDTRNETARRSPGQEHHHAGTTLSDVPRLLPTPRASAGVNGGPGQRGSSGDLAMPSAVQPEHWGRFGEAVARHAAIFGAPPAPTEPNRKGAPRLAPAFAEWLMCIPAGHVTDRLTRKDALAAIGNGVCPPQVAAAWALLTGPVDASLGQPVPSGTMTVDTSDVTQRAKEERDRAIKAGAAVLAQLSPETPMEVCAFTAAAVIKAATMELAKAWRETAEAIKVANKRGAKSMADQYTQVAGRLAGFAVGIEVSEIAPFPSACAHPEESLSTLASGGVRCTACGVDIMTQDEPRRAEDLMARAQADSPGLERDENGNFKPTGDPTLDYLSGAASTYEPGGSNVFASPPTSANQVTPVPVAVESPFVTPSAPGQRVAPVERVSWAALPALIGQAATLPPRTTTSHSMVEDAESCTLKATFGRLSRHGNMGPARPGWALVGGSAFHSAVEYIEQAHLDGDFTLTEPEAFWRPFLDKAVADRAATLGHPFSDSGTWHASDGGKEGYDWWRVQGAEMIRLYVKVHDAAWRERYKLLRIADAVPALELPYNTQLGVGGPQVEGFLDQAWLDTQTYQIEVHDLKAGKTAPRETFQLGEYGHALLALMGTSAAEAVKERPLLGRYYLARGGTFTNHVDLLATHPIEEVAFRHGQALFASRMSMAMPSVTPFCGGCGFRDYCPTQG